MKVKIFVGSGHDDIKKVESEINEWMERLPRLGGEVKNSQTALCQVAERSDGERYQYLVVTVWYEPQ